MDIKIIKALNLMSQELEKIPITVIFVITLVVVFILWIYIFFIPHINIQEVLKKKYQKYCLVILLVIYVGIMLLITVLTRDFSSNYRFNFIPFNSILNFHHINGEIIQDINNILLFFPLGVLYTCQHKTNQLKKTIWISFLLSIGIEVIQFVGKLGKFDIDDIIFNVLGGFLGGSWVQIWRYSCNKDRFLNLILRIFMIISSAVTVGLGIVFGVYHLIRINGGKIMELELFNRKFEFFTDNRQWKKLIDFLQVHFDLSGAFGIFLCILTIYIIFILFSILSHKNNIKKILLQCGVIIYLGFILQYSVFSNNSDLRGIRLTITPWFVKQSGFHESVILVSFINMLLYLPYGYMLPSRMQIKHRFLVSFGLIALTAFVMEWLQYVFATGITSLEDGMANTIGGLIGIVLYAIINCMKNCVTRH